MLGVCASIPGPVGLCLPWTQFGNLWELCTFLLGENLPWAPPSPAQPPQPAPAGPGPLEGEALLPDPHTACPAAASPCRATVSPASRGADPESLPGGRDRQGV